jgi:AcrR family transcriptional regulator
MAEPAPEGLRERNKRGRAERILEATRELIREQPERDPTVDAIARRADVAPATVFNLIGPRERIWAALADAALGEALESIADADAEDPHDRARQIVTTTIDVFVADAAVYRHVLSKWSASGALLEHDPTAELRACLREGSTTGTLDEQIDVRALARHIATACTGAMHQWVAATIDQRELRRRCIGAVDITFAAVASDEETRRHYLAAVPLTNKRKEPRRRSSHALSDPRSRRTPR